MGVTLRNFMTTENVLTISGDATLTEAARQMCDRNVGAVVVVEAEIGRAHV